VDFLLNLQFLSRVYGPKKIIFGNYNYQLNVNVKLSLGLTKYHAMKTCVWRYSFTHS